MADQTDQDGKKTVLTNQNVEISPQTQETLNKPLKHAGDIGEKDHEFLALLVEKIEKGEIKLFEPSTLINSAVYNNLDERAKGKVDYDAFNLLATIREIYNLWKQGEHDSYQVENLVHRIRVTKERLEELGGDIYII